MHVKDDRLDNNEVLGSDLVFVSSSVVSFRSRCSKMAAACLEP